VWVETVRARTLPLPAGTVVALPYMKVTVLEDRGGLPSRVEFRFPRPLEDPALVFLVLSRDRLRRFDWPPIGVEVALPRGQPFQRSASANSPEQESGGRGH
jgi:hypothetical protein